jgi:hypothetical protein
VLNSKLLSLGKMKAKKKKMDNHALKDVVSRQKIANLIQLFM